MVLSYSFCKMFKVLNTSLCSCIEYPVHSFHHSQGDFLRTESPVFSVAVYPCPSCIGFIFLSYFQENATSPWLPSNLATSCVHISRISLFLFLSLYVQMDTHLSNIISIIIIFLRWMCRIGFRSCVSSLSKCMFRRFGLYLLCTCIFPFFTSSEDSIALAEMYFYFVYYINVARYIHSKVMKCRSFHPSSSLDISID